MAAFWILLGAFLGIAGKYLVDLLLANRRKLPEEKLKFLAAAGRVAQAVAAWCNWQQELQHRSAVDPDELTVDELARLAERSAERRARIQRARIQRARVDAYKARGTVRLLVPDVARDAFDYLELSAETLDEGPDKSAMLENTRRKQIGA